MPKEAVISEAVAHQIQLKAKELVANMTREQMVEMLFGKKKAQFKAAEKQKAKQHEDRILKAEQAKIVEQTLKELGLYDEVMAHAKRAAQVELASGQAV